MFSPALAHAKGYDPQFQKAGGMFGSLFSRASKSAAITPPPNAPAPAPSPAPAKSPATSTPSMFSRVFGRRHEHKDATPDLRSVAPMSREEFQTQYGAADSAVGHDAPKPTHPMADADGFLRHDPGNPPAIKTWQMSPWEGTQRGVRGAHYRLSTLLPAWNEDAGQWQWREHSAATSTDHNKLYEHLGIDPAAHDSTKLHLAISPLVSGKLIGTPLTESQLAVASGGKLGSVDTSIDWRPEEMLPEDYYAKGYDPRHVKGEGAAATAAPPAPKAGLFGRLFGRNSSAPAPKPTAPKSPAPKPEASAGAALGASTPTAVPAAHAHTDPNHPIHSPAFKNWFGDWAANPAQASKVVHSETGEPLDTYHVENPPAPGVAHVPKVVYHGNPRGPVTEFRPEWHQKHPDALHYGPGFYFTEDVDAGDAYAHGATGAQVADKNPAVGSYYLKVHNPFDADRDTIDPTKLSDADRKSVRAAYVSRVLAEQGRSEALAAGREFDEGKLKLKYRELTDSAGVGGYGASKAGIAKHLQELGYDGITVMGPDVKRPGANRFWIAFHPTQIKSTANRGTFDPNHPSTLKAYTPAGKADRPHRPPPKMTPTALAAAIAVLKAKGMHAEAEYLTQFLPPAHGPLPHLDLAAGAGPESPSAPNVSAPGPSGAGGLPRSGPPRPANPAGAGSLPPKLTKAFDVTSPLDWFTNSPEPTPAPASFPAATVPAGGREVSGALGCVYLTLPPEAAHRIRALANQIPDYDLADDGREDKPHVTLLYGLHDDDPEPVCRVLAHHRPAKIRLGRVSVFPGAEYDVVKCEVEGDGLHRMNAALRSLPHTNAFPEYLPHATIAYVRPGLGAVYAARFGDLDLRCCAGTAVHSSRDRTKHVLPLGRTITVEKAMSALDATAGGALIGSKAKWYKKKLERNSLALLCHKAIESFGEPDPEVVEDTEEFVFGTKSVGVKKKVEVGYSPRHTKGAGEAAGAPKPPAPNDETPPTTAELEGAGQGRHLHANVQIKHAASGDWVVKGRANNPGAVQAESTAASLAPHAGVDVPPVHHVKVYGQDAAAVRHVPGTALSQMQPDERRAALAAVPKEHIDRHALFDYLIGSGDPNNGNYMIRPGGGLTAIDKENSLAHGTVGKRAHYTIPFFLADAQEPGKAAGDYAFHPEHVAAMADAGARMVAHLQAAGRSADAVGVARRTAVLKSLSKTGKPVYATALDAAGRAYDNSSPPPTSVLERVRRTVLGW